MIKLFENWIDNQTKNLATILLAVVRAVSLIYIIILLKPFVVKLYKLFKKEGILGFAKELRNDVWDIYYGSIIFKLIIAILIFVLIYIMFRSVKGMKSIVRKIFIALLSIVAVGYGVEGYLSYKYYIYYPNLWAENAPYLRKHEEELSVLVKDYNLTNDLIVKLGTILLSITIIMAIFTLYKNAEKDNFGIFIYSTIFSTAIIPLLAWLVLNITNIYIWGIAVLVIFVVAYIKIKFIC